MKGIYVFTVTAMLLFSINASAQSKTSGSIKGILMDSASQQSLKDATVSVMDPTDSSLIAYSITKADGIFSLLNVPFGQHLLVISFSGYKTVEQKITLSAEKPEYNAKTIFLITAPKELEGVTVTASPITIKGDTTEFNANQFKTKPNGTAEDMLKKMPGLEVEKDGSIKAQGQAVTRILVDGKRFFGDDPTLATRNLPNDMIDKIQVIDAQSDQSAFSGIDDGNRVMTINIVTKKDRRKGLFGKASFGAGNEDLTFESDSRYAASLNLSYFNGDRRLTLIGQSNNNNSQNFGAQDVLGVSGAGYNGGGNRGGGGNVNRGGGNSFGGGFSTGPTGFTRTWIGGLNYSDVWSPKTTFSASYFYNNQNRINNQDRLRETFVAGDSSRFTTSNNFSNNNNANHRVNFEIEHKLDTMNSILFRPSYSQQKNEDFSQSVSSTTKGKTSPVNDVTRTTRNKSEGYNLNNSLLFRHRFAKRGRSISFQLLQSESTNEQEQQTVSYNNSYQNGGVRRDTTDQISNNDRKTKSYGGTIAYVEPIGVKGKLELNYNYNHNLNMSDRVAMQFNKLTGKYDVNNVQLSNTFENLTVTNRLSLNYQRQITQQFNYTLGLGVQKSEITNNNTTKKTYINRSFNNFTPTFSLQYRKQRTINMRLDYRGSTQQPNVEQIQDVINNANPLYISTGNPNLRQEFSNSLNLSFSKNNPVNFHNIQINVSGSMVSNRIGNEIFQNNTDTTIVVENISLIRNAQFVRPVNLKGGYNMNGSFNYNFPLKNPKSNISLNTNLNYRRDVNLINSIVKTGNVSETVPSYTNNYIIGQTIRLSMNLKERFDLNFSSRSTFNFARYNEQAKLTSTRTNSDYFTEVLSVEPTYVTKKGLILSNDLDYNVSRGQATGYNQSFAMWNGSIAQQLFKKKQGEIRLTVYDLLNQNRSITRNVQANYIEDTRTDVLKRYFMLTFTYNIRKFGGGQQGQQGQQNRSMMRGDGGGGGGMRQFRNN